MLKKYLPYILSVFFLLFLWELLARWVNYPAIFPDVKNLFIQIGLLFSRPEFYVAVFYTILRGLSGFIIAFSSAIVLAILSVYSPFFKSFLHPVIVVSRTIPVISLVLIALLWFSSGLLPVFIAFFTMFPILYQHMLSGFESTDKKLVEMSVVFGKSSLAIWNHIYFPSAKKQIFSGVSAAFGFGWRAIIIGEALSQPLHGIGSGMKQAQAYINVSELIAWTVAAVLLSSLFEWLVNLCSQYQSKVKSYELYHTTYKKYVVEEKICQLQKVNKKYNDPEINFPDIIFRSDVIHCLKSPSGSGKTTLLGLIAGILKPDKGKIQLEHIYRMSYSFQDVRLIPWLNVEQNILYSLKHRSEWSAEAKSNFDELVQQLEIEDVLKKLPAELSGGQQQRVGLARALLLPVDMLLLDEPLNGLDQTLKIKTIAAIESYVLKSQPLVVWATHENIKMEKINIAEHLLPALK